MKLEELNKLLAKHDLTEKEIDQINQVAFSTELGAEDRIRAIEFLLSKCTANADILGYDAQEYELELQEKLEELKKGLTAAGPDKEGPFGFGDNEPQSNEEQFGFGDDLQSSEEKYGFGDEEVAVSTQAINHQGLAQDPKLHSPRK